MTVGFEVFVQLVIAAMTTLPCPSSNCVPSSSTSTEAGSTSATATRAGSGSGACAPSPPGTCSVVGSLAGKVSATALSWFPYSTPKV